VADGSDPTRCDSCGDTDVAVAPVRRVYLNDGIVDDDVEMWCEVCRLHYPHEPG
jgi:hypothetical protein